MSHSKIIVKPPGPKARECWKRSTASKLRPPSHIFPGLVPSRGEGIYIIDVDGNRYIDFTAQRFSVGHNHPKVLESIKQIITRGGDIETSTMVALAEKLKAVVPPSLSDGLVAFTRGGTLATEQTILTVRRYSGRSAIFACQGSYHGGALASLSLTMTRSEMRKGLYPLMFDVVYTPYAYCYRCPFGQEYPGCGFQCVKYVRYVLDTVAYPDDTAAFFIEPVQAHGGVVVPPDGYLERVREICDEHQILLVDDEVVTGLGRTGKMFGIEYWNVQPDILLMGKPLGSMLSLGAIIGRREVMETYMGGTGGFSIPCAAAMANIEVVLEERLLENASRVGEHIMKRLRELQEGHEIIGDVRGKGLLIGLELVKDRESKRPATKEARDVLVKAYQNGLLMIPGGTYRQSFRLTPPLIITREEADEAVDILERTFKDLQL